MPRGGARPNSGPKRKPRLPPVADKATAGRILDHLHQIKAENERWAGYVDGPNADLSLRAYLSLYDRRDGRPAQGLKLSGHIEHELDIADRRTRVAELLANPAGRAAFLEIAKRSCEEGEAIEAEQKKILPQPTAGRMWPPEKPV